jgi:hypothetical protein
MFIRSHPRAGGSGSSLPRKSFPDIPHRPNISMVHKTGPRSTLAIPWELFPSNNLWYLKPSCRLGCGSIIMKFLTALLRIAVLLQSFGPHALAEDDFQYHFECPSGRRVKRELGPRLSGRASISLPSSPEWDLLLARAGSPRINPLFVASVEPATEDDVQETVSRLGSLFSEERSH